MDMTESHIGNPNPKLNVKMNPFIIDSGLIELKSKLSVSGVDKKVNKQNCNISTKTDIADTLILCLAILFTFCL